MPAPTTMRMPLFTVSPRVDGLTFRSTVPRGCPGVTFVVQVTASSRLRNVWGASGDSSSCVDDELASEWRHPGRRRCHGPGWGIYAVRCGSGRVPGRPLREGTKRRSSRSSADTISRWCVSHARWCRARPSRKRPCRTPGLGSSAASSASKVVLRSRHGSFASWPTERARPVRAKSASFRAIRSPVVDAGALRRGRAVGRSGGAVASGASMTGWRPPSGRRFSSPHWGNCPQRQRTVVVLRDVEGLSSDDVCAVLGISAGNQRILLHRGRSRMREILDSEIGRD